MTDLTRNEFKAVTLKGISVRKTVRVSEQKSPKVANTAQIVGIIDNFGNVKYVIKDWIYG